MAFGTVLLRALRLVRQHPLVFLPRILMTTVWSIYWLYIVQLLLHPATVTLHDITVVSTVTVVLSTMQIWLYTTYFLIAQQYEHDRLDLADAFRTAAGKLPRSIAVFGLLGTVCLVLGTPGAIMYMYGQEIGYSLLQIGGIAWSIAAVFGVMVTAYFAPVAVVLGEYSFIKNLRNGIQASREDRREVVLATAFAFGALLLTTVVRGEFWEIGVAGFFLGRIIAAVMETYLLLINPELFLNRED